MHRRYRTVLASAVTALGFAGMANADVITTLYSTGVDNAGSLLADGSTDPHYTVSPGGGPFVIGSPGSVGWAANTSTSQWISPGTDTFGGGGPFTYTTTFDLTGFDPSTASISGFMSSDNWASIYLDSVLVGINAFPAWGGLVPFAISSGFQSGLNTLEFVVPNNDAPGPNDGPTGLQVQIVTATVPEPASLALLGLGLAGLGFARRRKAS